VIGAVAVLAAFSYDVFRLPFVFANQWHLASVVPPMPLFKVFPEFGRMSLDTPSEPVTIRLAGSCVGWTCTYKQRHTSASCTWR